MLSPPAPVRTLIAVASVVFQFTQVFGQEVQTRDSFPPLRANRLMGMTVENGDGRELGKLRNFTLDTDSGRLQYAIVATGGFMGARTKYRAVPPQILSAATAKRDVIAMSITKDRWDVAPTFKLSEITARVHLNREQQIAGFYQTAGVLPATSADRSAESNGTGSPRLKLATDLIGRTIFNADGEKLGSVLDLLMALDPDSPVLVVFSAGKLFKGREHAYVVPLRDTVVGKKNNLFVNVKRQSLVQAKPFNERAWHAIPTKGEAPQIFSYAMNQ